MDKARICRELAEKLEPWPNENTVIWSMSRSPLKFWSQGGYDVFMGGTADFNWHPFNPFDSAEDSERLLEAMPAPLLAMNKPGDLMGVYIAKWLCQASGSPIIEAFDDDRRTAIVLAACKWL